MSSEELVTIEKALTLIPSLSPADAYSCKGWIEDMCETHFENLIKGSIHDKIKSLVNAKLKNKNINSELSQFQSNLSLSQFENEMCHFYPSVDLDFADLQIMETLFPEEHKIVQNENECPKPNRSTNSVTTSTNPVFKSTNSITPSINPVSKLTIPFKDSNSYFNNQKQSDNTPDIIDTNMKESKPQYHQTKTDHTIKDTKPPEFITANEQLSIQQSHNSTLPKHVQKKQLSSIQPKRQKFISPLVKEDNQKQTHATQQIDDRLKNIDSKMIETLMNEVIDKGPQLDWDDIAGLIHAKETIKEIVVWPMLRPDIFKGLRGPPKGLLLFGPPGTGKTLIGKCIASQANATFFSISSSSLTSKWVGEGEKMVTITLSIKKRALFAVARVHQPAVIFMDEIDSLLSQRKDDENEATRRIKTEFLVQFDGCGTNQDDRILIIGATNRPHEIDEAARRRFRKKLYIPLPCSIGRSQIVKNLLQKQSHTLDSDQLSEIVIRTQGYSGSDMDGLVREASLGPIRDVKDIRNVSADDVRSINFSDFEKALMQVRASVSEKDLKLYIDFDGEYGSRMVKDVDQMKD